MYQSNEVVRRGIVMLSETKHLGHEGTRSFAGAQDDKWEDWMTSGHLVSS